MCYNIFPPPPKKREKQPMLEVEVALKNLSWKPISCPALSEINFSSDNNLSMRKAQLVNMEGPNRTCSENQNNFPDVSNLTSHHQFKRSFEIRNRTHQFLHFSDSPLDLPHSAHVLSSQRRHRLCISLCTKIHLLQILQLLEHTTQSKVVRIMQINLCLANLLHTNSVYSECSVSNSRLISCNVLCWNNWF